MLFVSHDLLAKPNLPLLPAGGGRPFRVLRKEIESEEVVSFHLVPVDGGTVAMHRPGQHIGLRMEIDGQEVRRSYSLSAVADGLHYRIGVKREPGGLASSHLHDWTGVGDVLEILPPAGSFVLQDGDRPLVLLSGGIGIMPTLAMLQAALASTRPVYFIHAARHAGVHVSRAWTEAVAAKHARVHCFYCYEQHDGTAGTFAPNVVGLLGFDHLEAWLPEEPDMEAYVVGPSPFMRAMKRHLARLGVPASQTHHEFFGPIDSLD